MTNKITNKAQPLFAKELSARLGYPEDTEKEEERPATPQESSERPTDEQSNIDPESEDDIIEAKKEEKDENLKGVFKKIASQIHPDK